MLRKKLHDSKGFTLIELLIVVVIIGILAAIAIPQFASTKEKAYDASAKSDVRNMMAAQEAHFSTQNAYWDGSVSAGTVGGTASMGGDVFRASPNVAVTAQSATNGYTITGKHNASSRSWCVDTTPGGNSNVQSCP
ncbi:MAG: prepilin-type N-terminal cleavage/methylation domain-containing protein [Gemmatimonadota bacterium]